MALITPSRAIELQPALESYSTAEIAAALESVSAAIESRCNRKFAQATVVDQVIETDQYGYTWLNRPPITAGSFSVKMLTGTANLTGFILNTESGELILKSHPNHYLKASFQGGFATIPAGVELAAAAMTLRLLTRLPRLGSVSQIQIGSETTAFSVTGAEKYELFDPAILHILGPYILGGLA